MPEITKPSKDEIIKAFIEFIEVIDFEDEKMNVSWEAHFSDGNTQWQGNYSTANFQFTADTHA